MKKLIFIHIPKTAGTSIYKVLSSAFEKDRFSTGVYVNHVKHSALEGKQFFAGHFGINDIKKITDEELEYFTFVRNPYERVSSLYYYWKSHQHALYTPDRNPSYYGVRRAGESDSFLDFLNTEDQEVLKDISNCQCRYISGAVDDPVNVNSLLLFFRAIFSIWKNKIFVGLTDETEKSLELLIKRLHIAPNEKISARENVTKNRPSNSTKEDRRIRSLNRADIMLYWYVKFIYGFRSILSFSGSKTKA
tara:strand:+ start:2958 stop:3701 length:744 start_codon:yes stop_codon:yes gene_type:complete